MRRRRSRFELEDDAVVGINVTPLVDVCLVLVIIFMVATPMMSQPAFEVALPVAKTKEGQEERMKAMGITDVKRIYTERDLAPGPEIIFAASGVTDGSFMKGVRFFGHGSRTSALVMSLGERLIRFVDSVWLDGDPDVVVEF